MEKILRELNRFAENFNSEDIDYLGFIPSISDEDKYELLKRGWWHFYFFGSQKHYNLGFRISPKLAYCDWPIMQIHEYSSAITIAPRISSVWYFVQLSFLLNLKVYNTFDTDINIIEKLSLPLLKIVKGSEHFEYFINHILKKEIIPDSQENKNKLHLHFWNYFDKSQGHKVLRKIITDISSDEDLIIKDVDFDILGMWKTRVLYILVQRFRMIGIYLEDDSQIEKLFWELFQCINIFDAEGMLPKHIFDNSNEPEISLAATIASLDTLKDRRAEYIKNNPLYPALLKLGSSRKNYLGVEHIEAAAIYDSELNDPIMSWNCLVNAAYWSGLNTSETLLPAWEAAIYLAEKHNWKDAHFALKTQYDWYLNYKRGNNIE